LEVLVTAHRAHLCVLRGTQSVFIFLVILGAIFEVFAVLGCYAACVGSRSPTFRDSLSFPYTRAKRYKKE